MLVKGLSIVNSVTVHSVISVRLQHILAHTMGKNHFLAKYVSIHSLGNVILLLILGNLMRLECVQVWDLTHAKSVGKLMFTSRNSGSIVMVIVLKSHIRVVFAASLFIERVSSQATCLCILAKKFESSHLKLEVIEICVCICTGEKSCLYVTYVSSHSRGKRSLWHIYVNMLSDVKKLSHPHATQIVS